MFEPSNNGKEIFFKRYTIHEGETWEEACDRVASFIASAEDGEKRQVYKQKFKELLQENLFMPGGRIWYGSGRPRGQLLNCFVVPTQDSREGWGKAVSDVIVISGTGGGVGLNFSPVRPRGLPIRGTGGITTGAVSLMEGINGFGDIIKAGGGRRTALMFGLNLNHPDILEFLDKKLDLKQLNNANISVVFNEDPEDFFTKVKSNEELVLTFNGKEIGRVKAKTLFEKIVVNALKQGDPGVLNGYYANRMSNVWYWKNLIITNPCGEIWLTEYDCCCLGSIVLPRFVEGGFQWSDLEEAVKTAVRFLDNVLTVNTYPLQEIKDTCGNIRRIGLGVMGLHDMLLKMGFKYTSPEGLEFVDRVMKFIKNRAYEASIELAKEKGAFPVFDSEKFLKSNFIKTLKPTIRQAIKKYGIRNCALLTLPPTGTTSMVSGVSSGIEAVFAPAYIRKWWDGDIRKSEVLVHPLFEQFVKDGVDTSHFQGTYDLSLRDHFEMQRVCQRHIDNAVSKTINVMPGVSVEELSELLMEYLPELKGVTMYAEGSRENQPLTPLSVEEALTAVGNSLAGTLGGACRSGVCDV